jgi:hypothetical protein
MDELYMEMLMQDQEYMMQLEWEQSNVPNA